MNKTLIALGLALASVYGQDISDPSSIEPEPSPVTLTPVVVRPFPGDVMSAPAKRGDRAAVYSVGDTPPNIANYLMGNPGSCTVNVHPTSGNVILFHPGAPGLGFNWCVLVRPINSGCPYTFTAGFRGHVFDKAASLALVMFDIFTGKFEVVNLPGSSDTGISSISSWKMANFTTYVAPPIFSFTAPAATGGILPSYIRVKDDCTTRTVAITHDPTVDPYITTNSVPSAGGYVNPNFIGFGLRGTGNGLSSLMTIYHESLTTP